MANSWHQMWKRPACSLQVVFHGSEVRVVSAGCLHAEEHEKIFFGQIILSVMV